MAEIILDRTGMTAGEAFHTIHNYIDTEEMILRKGAIAAFTAPRAPRTKYDDEGNVVDEGLKTEDKPDTSNVTIDDATAAREEIKADTTASMPAYKTESSKSGDVPDWFKSAQSKAKKSDKAEDEEGAAGQRSRFAHTMDVMAARQEEEEAKKKAEEEKKRAELRAQIEAANKAAEEERQKKFGDKKPFYRSENSPEDTQAMDAIEAEKPQEPQEELTIDESFKQRVAKDTKPVKEEDKEEVKEEEVKSEEKLKPEDSGQIRVDQMQQYAPLDDQEFISSNEMPQNEALTELPEVYTDEKNIEENPEYAKALKEDDAKNEELQAAKSSDELEKGKFGTGSFAAVSESEGIAGATANPEKTSQKEKN